MRNLFAASPRVQPAHRHREIAYKAKDLLQGFGREIEGTCVVIFVVVVIVVLSGGEKKGNGGGQSRDCGEGR